MCLTSATARQGQFRYLAWVVLRAGGPIAGQDSSSDQSETRLVSCEARYLTVAPRHCSGPAQPGLYRTVHRSRKVGPLLLAPPGNCRLGVALLSTVSNSAAQQTTSHYRCETCNQNAASVHLAPHPGPVHEHQHKCEDIAASWRLGLILPKLPTSCCNVTAAVPRTSVQFLLRTTAVMMISGTRGGARIASSSLPCERAEQRGTRDGLPSGLGDG